MAAEPSIQVFEDLSRDELNAVIAAATWYAKRHESIIAELADDRSASASVTRDRYQALHTALAKLGVRLRRPAGIRAA